MLYKIMHKERMWLVSFDDIYIRNQKLLKKTNLNTWHFRIVG